MRNYFIYIFLILFTVGLNAIAQKHLKEQWNLWIGYGIPALIMAVFMWNISAAPLFHDFNVAYYPASRLMLRCLASKDMSSLHNIYNPEEVEAFVNIPIIALLFFFSALDKIIAQALMFILGIVAIFTSYAWLAKIAEDSKFSKAILLGIFVMNGPLYYSLRLGNLTHFVFLLLVLAVIFINKKHEVGAGIILAFAALIKPPLLLLLVYYILRRKWQIVSGFSIALLGIIGLSLFMFGINLHIVWFRQWIQPLAFQSIGAFNVQSINSFLVRLTNDYKALNWSLYLADRYVIILRYVLTASLTGVVGWVFWQSKPPVTHEEEYLEFSVILCLSLLISPLSWTHYYLFLLLPFSLYLGHKLAIPKGRIWSILMFLSLLLISLPVLFVESSRPILTFLLAKFFISHYFFGGILLLGVLLAARWCKNGLQKSG